MLHLTKPLVGNKNLPCPTCGEEVQISIRIGYQSYVCSKTRREVSIQDQIKSFSQNGLTVGIDKYIVKRIGPQEIIPASRFPVLAEWCFQVAVRCGYPEMEAYSMALARSRVSSSNPNIRTISTYTYDGKVVTPREVPQSTIEVEKRNFMGIGTPITIRPDGQVRGIYYRNDIPQICNPDIFEKIVVDKFRHNHYKQMQLSLRDLASLFSGKDLDQYGTFFWNQFAPIAKDGKKPEAGKSGFFCLGIINNLIRAFTVPHYVKALREEAA